MPTFWELDRNWKSPRHRAEWDHNAMDLELVECPLYPGHKRTGKRLTNLSVVLPDRDVQNFVWTFQGECMVQDSTLEFFRDTDITGFELKPVKARFATRPEKPPRLWEIIVTGWAGMAKPESGIHYDETESCSVCGMLRYTGLKSPAELIDETQWDGSDFFKVWPMPRFIFVTNRVVELIRKHHLTGAYPKLVTKLEKTKSFGPGRLRYYMSDDRAKELGIPLGIY